MIRSLLLSTLVSLCLFPMTGTLDAAEQRPNIIFILTDDLGYGDVGAFFQNLRRAKNDPAAPWHLTPHLDRLATEGIQLRDSYCPAPVCAPSRSSLLTGVTQGHARVRDNQFDWELARNHTLGSVMKGAGYATAAFGKWGLQGLPKQEIQDARDWPGHPLKRGFDFYFGYIRHVDGHFHYPFEDGREVYENYQNVAPGLKLCYTTDLFTARAKKWIVDHAAARPDQPFFIYLAYDTPHAKLQNPPCSYPEGGGLTGGVQWLGTPGHMINTATGDVDSCEHPDYRNATWDDDHNPTTPPRPWPDVDKRYATDVRRIDDAVGDLMQLLVDLKIDRNTIVVFTSDNGPSIESYLQGKDGNGFSYSYKPTFFESFGPFDGIKRDCWEGGVRMPTMARWPGHIPAGRIDTTPCGAWDWLATVADLGGQPAPARTDGVSLVPTLTGRGRQRPSSVYVEYFQNGRTPTFDRFAPAHRGRKRGQMQIVRLGNYLGVRYNITSARDDFEIYDVTADPQETHNLASRPEFAGLQQRMKDRALQGRMPNPFAKRPYDDAPVPAVGAARQEAGVRWQAFAGDWPWLPKFETMTPSAGGKASRPELGAALTGRNNGVLFDGFLNVPTTGEYTFYVTSDGPNFLRIHDCQVVDGDFGHTAGTTAEGRILLAKGLHPFRLYYARKSDGAASSQLKFEWSGPGIDRQVVPAAVFSHHTEATASSKPNILFILVDDYGIKDVGVEGSMFYETPHIDRLARSGMRFTQGYAACQVCSPSRASIMLGKYPARHGITDYIGAAVGETFARRRHVKLLPADYVRNLPAADTTLAEALKQAGYTTFFAGKWHLGGKGSWPEDHGFDINKGGWDAGSPMGGYYSPWKNPNLPNGPKGESLTQRLASETIAFLEQNRDKPFLAYLSFYAVHGPIQTTKPLWSKYREKASRLPPPEERFKIDRTLPVRQLQDNPIYAGLIENMDTAVGRVLTRLEELGLADNTIICFTGDNGGVSSGDSFSSSELPYRGGKGRQWEGGLRVPFYIKAPGVTRPGSTCGTPVMGVDFYPTILELAGLPQRPQQHMDGVSLVPLLKGGKIAPRPLFWHYPHYGNQGGEPSSIIRQGDWKLIHYWEDNRDELYHLSNDIGEQHDLAAQEPERTARLWAQLQAWLQETGAKIPQPNPEYTKAMGEQNRKNAQLLKARLEKSHAAYLDPDWQPNPTWWDSLTPKD